MEGGSAAAASIPSLYRAASAAQAMGTGSTPEESERMMKSSLHLEEDDFVPELQRSIHPRERPDWEETISAMARGGDFPELQGPGELPLRSCGSTASMKMKNVKKLSFTKGHFPKLAECAHFHYENVDFGSIQLSLPEEQNEVTRNGFDSKELVYLIQISCQGRSWIVKRSYEDFRVLDKHLHLCIYDRRFSQLSELPRSDSFKDNPEVVTQMLMAYLSRLSAIAGNKINCGPALTWMEIDNKGNHLLVHEESSINVPAIAAAHVIKRYNAQAADELSFEVGDIVSVIDMPPKELTTWWRGKHGFQVGFFPSECVELINDKVPQSVSSSVPKPVSKKHGKLITFLRTFMKSRPTKQKLKQRGILKERVFGCDLGEHLLNSGHDVPQVLKSCTEFIEKHGIVDGIYRLSGIASNIQKLRHEFDSEQIPDLTKDVYIQDIHCVGSLCKLYFRELPNPLLTYQLYEKFSDAVSAATDEERLVKIHDVIQQLPPPHYRTLEFLMRHLSRLATYCAITNMHTKNLAIVWAPNLLRSKQIESACFSGTAAFMEVRIQSVVVEFILNHVDMLFSPKLSSVIRDGAGHGSLVRPKSLLVSSPSTKLLTLEEARARTQAQINSPVVGDSKYIEVGEGPAALQGKFHTVIEFPSERKRPPSKAKKSPVGNWRSFFNLGKSSSSSSVSKRKLQRNPSEPSEMKALALAGGRGDTGTLRSAKSEESLTSLHAMDGESKLFRPRRPRSSSDALSASYNGDLLENLNRCNSYDNLPHDNETDADEGLIHVPALMSPRSPEEVDLSPPDIGVASLDFDPMSFQCSPPQLEYEGPDCSASQLDYVGSSGLKDKHITSRKDLESGSQSQNAGSAPSSESVSPFQERLTSPFFSMDMSPSEEKASKPSSFAEKVVHAFSPKIGRKSTKSPPMNISEPITISLPDRVSEMMGGMAAAPGNTSPPNWNKGTIANETLNKSPPQMMSLLLKTTEVGASEGLQQEIQERNVRGVSQIQGDVAEPPRMNNPHMVASSVQIPSETPSLDSPQDPVPVSTVSLIPPPPPPKNAARMLALALAESAQQASAQKRPINNYLAHPNTPESVQTCVTEEKPQPQSGTPTERMATTMMTALMAATSTSAESMGHISTGSCGASTQGSPIMTSPSTVLEVLAPAIQRSPTSNQPAQQQQLAVGQIPAGTAMLSGTPNLVQMGMSSQVLEKSPQQPEPKIAQPAPTFITDMSSTIRPPPVAPVAPPGLPEKPRESCRAPFLHMRSESFPTHSSYVLMPPVPPVRSVESKIAAAIHSSNSDAVNASNYYSFLASSLLPSSVEDALPPPLPPPPSKHASLQSAYLSHSKADSMPESVVPENYMHHKPSAIPQPTSHQYRPEGVPTPHLSYHSSKTDHHQIYGSRADASATLATHYNTYMNQGKNTASHHSKPRSRVEYLASMSPSLRISGYSEEAPPYPTIRRVQSLHAPPPPPLVRSAPISRTEVPPDDEPIYCPRPLYQYKPYQPFMPHSDYHVTQLQPYFENGRVHYRYSPYSGSSGATYYSSDGTFYDLDPYSTARLRQQHSLHNRDFASYTTRQPAKNLYRSASMIPYPRGSIMGQLAGKEHSFISRDVPPAPEAKHMHVSWDLEDLEKYRMQSIRRESRARQKVKGPVMSQYDNVTPVLQDELGGIDIIHLRSRSDPGKTGLLSVAEGKEGRYPTKAFTPEGDENYYLHHPESGTDRIHYHGIYGNGQSEKPSLPQKQGSMKNRKLHDPTCNAPEQRTHIQQEPSHRQSSEANNGPPYPVGTSLQLDYSSKSLQEPSESVGYHHSSGKYNISGQDPVRLNHKEVRLSEERPDMDRPRPRQSVGAEKHSRDLFKEEEKIFQPMAPPPKPERSQSLRLRHPETIERDPSQLYQYQSTLGKRQSTMTVVSQYDNLEDYHAVAPHQRSGIVAPGFSHPQNRTYTTALGQGAFLPSEQSLQRLETEIHAE
ncbi:rho GTPase-activating protein 32 isoform X2 [Rhinatrema bivittatum]|uniref:rho GTPase-activating protein 32 isoform X2 n=1 Tax=Rhinatrema bivittatum TaxID=194408 RepID=UPI00112C071E|nr:rho GTPase-activating protein 32 isoform X2 [Rhinatrema bivittatum]